MPSIDASGDTARPKRARGNRGRLFARLVLGVDGLAMLGIGLIGAVLSAWAWIAVVTSDGEQELGESFLLLVGPVIVAFFVGVAGLGALVGAVAVRSRGEGPRSPLVVVPAVLSLVSVLFAMSTEDGFALRASPWWIPAGLHLAAALAARRATSPDATTEPGP